MTSYSFYEPFYDLDRLFGTAYGPSQQPVQRRGGQDRDDGDNTIRHIRPRMDLYEDVKHNMVMATFELPGLTKENIDIDVNNGRLTVTGECKASSDRDEQGYAVRERRYGKCLRTLQLPQGVKDKDVKASMRDGILTVTFPKLTPETASRKITVN